MPMASDNVMVRPGGLTISMPLVRLIGPASLIFCPLLLIGYLSFRYGFDAGAGLRAMAAIYALCVIPGYVVQRFVFRIQAATPFEGLLSSLLLGTLLSPLLWFTLCWIGLSSVFYPAMFALALAVPFACGWHRQWADRLLRLVSPAETPILWLALALAVLWSCQLDLVSIRDGQVTLLPHNDHMCQTSLIAELARGVPPATVPFIAIADKWAYHHLPDVWCDMIRRVAGTDARDAYFFLALPLRYVFVCFACYLALVRRFGRASAVVGAGCVLAFVGYHGSPFVLTNWLLTYLYWNFPCSFGLIGVFLILYYVSTIRPDRPRGPLLLISILSVLLFWHKANFALATAPAVSILCAVILLRRRDVRWLLVCGTAQALLVAIRYLDVSTADLPAPLVFEPLRFVQYMWWKGTLWLKALDEAGAGWLSLPVQALLTIRRNVDALPALLKWPAIFMLCVAYLFHLGIAVGVYARLRCGFGRLRSHASAVDALMLLILAFCVAGFVVFPIQKGLVWNVSMHNFALVCALLFVLMGPALCDVVVRLRGKGRRSVAVGTALLVAAFVGNAYALGRKALGPTADVQDVISEGQYACYRYIEAATSQDAMVLQPRFEQGLFTAGLLTQRRVVLEWGAPVWEDRVDLQPILSDLRGFYRGIAAHKDREILERYDVDVVVAKWSLPQREGYAPFLTEVFRHGDMAVFCVDADVIAGGIPAADRSWRLQPSGRPDHSAPRRSCCPSTSGSLCASG